MRSKLLIIPSLLIFQVAGAQNTGSVALTQATVTTNSAVPSSTPVVPPDAPQAPAVAPAGETTYLDYKSVYEAATVEEEVKMAAERFSLTPSQQDIWLTAATDRRAGEKFAQEKLNSKGDNYEKEGVYRGLRAAHSTFHETIIGHLSPKQKDQFETDRLILQEKQKRLAKLPPPPPAPTVTAAPVDSTAIKTDEKAKGKKSKKKKKA